MGRDARLWLLAAAAALAATAILALRDSSASRRAATGAPTRKNTPAHAATPGERHSMSSAPHGGTASHLSDPRVLASDLPATTFPEDFGSEGGVPLVALQDGQPPQPARSSREPPIFDLLRHSKDAPIPQAVRDLAAEITRDATNDVGKARAIYDWLTKNIVYDTAEWENIASGATEYIHDHDPAAVLERGTTVCIGYAWLFDDLCEAAGVNATWLVGDVRGYRATPDDALVSNVRHAWNAVELEDGEWHLLDATWGALQEGEAESALSARRADYYFDTPPGQFVFDHLPEDEGWQLLDEAVPSETAFSVLPNLKPSFFTNGLKLGDDYTSVLRAQAGSGAALAFSAPAGTQAIATLGVADDPESFGRLRVAKNPAGAADGGGAGSTLAAVLPSLPAGEYVLRLYSGKAKAGLLECSADFLIKVE